MENLMNKIVAKPNFGNDPKTNFKIEKLLKVKAFNKMVEQADLLSDISNSSILNQSQFLQKSLLLASQNSFQKMLPNHSQMKEDDDPEKLPSFGQNPLYQEVVQEDELSQKVNALLGVKPVI